MTQAEDSRRTRIRRILGASALVVVLAAALAGFELLGRSAPGLVAEQTGVGSGPGGQLQVHGERLSASVFGDRFVFALRTAAGQVSPPAFVATFPIYPGSVIERSAVYRDSRRTLRGATYRTPTDGPAALDWYRAAFEAQAYRVTASDGESFEAEQGSRLVRVQTGPPPGPGATSVGVFASGD
jgi:hypothetical protein